MGAAPMGTRRATTVTLCAALLAAVLSGCAVHGDTSSHGSPSAVGTSGATASAASADPRQLPSKAQWLADVTAATRGVISHIDAHAHDAARPAIVLDIDNTALETQYDAGDPTPPVLAIERRAITDGYAVLIATARSSALTFSLAQLREAGYRPDQVCTRPSPTASVPASKLACRQRFTASGFTIVVNIGNRPTDFEGGLNGLAVRLPDYGGLLS